MALLDVAVLSATFFASYLIRDQLFDAWYGPMPSLSGHAWILGIIIPTWLVLLRSAALGHSTTISSLSRILPALGWTQLMGALVLFTAMDATRAYDVSRLFLGIFVVLSGPALLLEREIVRKLFASQFDWHGLGYPRVVIVANSEPATQRLTEYLEHLLLRTEIVGFLSLKPRTPGANGSRRYLGCVDDAEQIFREQVVDEVIASALSPGESQLTHLAATCLRRGITFRSFLDLAPEFRARAFVDTIGLRTFLVSLETVSTEPVSLVLKRLLDVVGAVVGLAAVGLVHLWYLPRLRRESPGPVYFSQVRMGRNGRPFKVLKFRTMYPDAEKHLDELRSQNEMKGDLFKMRDDPRLLPSGKLLRRRYLDELPQFWNVLRGEMSLVGTRPPTQAEFDKYRPRHHRRLNMKPGITGLWQLEGNQRVSDFEQVVELDRQYIDDWSLWLDLKIIWKTVAKVARAEGW